jgi:hypothetical protein
MAKAEFVMAIRYWIVGGTVSIFARLYALSFRCVSARELS